MARRHQRAGRVGGGGFGHGAGPLIGTNFLPFQPYKPPPAPSGSYDPALDAQLGQSQRGLGDLGQDTETANTRDTVDYASQKAELERQVGLLHQNYLNLGTSQEEQRNAAGVLSGGAVLQAAAKRTANEARDKVPLTNAMQQLALDMAPPDANSPLGGRRFQDRTTALTRGQREGAQFGIDVNNQELYQASQAGYVPPGPGEPGGQPSNEHVSGTGVHTRTQRSGNTVFTYDEHGRIVSRRRVGRSAGRVGGFGFGAGASF